MSPSNLNFPKDNNCYSHLNSLKRKRVESVQSQKKIKIYKLDIKDSSVTEKISTLVNFFDETSFKTYEVASHVRDYLNTHLKGARIFFNNETRLDLTIEQTRFLITGSNFIGSMLEELNHSENIIDSLIDPEGQFILNLVDQPDLINISLVDMMCLLRADIPNDPSLILKLLKIANFFDMPALVTKYQKALKNKILARSNFLKHVQNCPFEKVRLIYPDEQGSKKLSQKFLEKKISLKLIQELLIEEKQFLDSFGTYGEELRKACEEYLNSRLCFSVERDLDREITKLERKGLAPFIEHLNFRDTHLTDKQLAYVISAFPLKTLDVSDTRVKGDLSCLEDYREVKGKNLKELNLKCCVLKDSTVNLKILRKLEKLNLENTAIDGTCLERLTCKQHLKEINLNNCKNIKDDTLSLQGFDNLEKLILSVSPVDGSFIKKLTCQHSLKNIKFQSCKINELCCLQGFNRLEVVDLSYTNINRRCLERLTCRQTLKEISLAGCKNLNDDDLCLKGFDNLEKIDLSFTDIDGSILKQLTCKQQLKEINLSMCQNIRDTTLFFEEFDNLEKLDLSYTKVDGSSLKRLPCKERFKDITLARCINVRDATLSLEEFNNLEKINFNHTQIDGSCFTHLTCQHSLKEVNLIGCNSITDQTLGLNTFDSLETINLNNNKSKIDGSFLRHLSCHHSLKKINLANSEVTDKATALSFKGFNNLEEIDLSNTDIDGACLEELDCQESLKVIILDGCINMNDKILNLKNFYNLEKIGLRINKNIDVSSLKRSGLSIYTGPND